MMCSSGRSWRRLLPPIISWVLWMMYAPKTRTPKYARAVISTSPPMKLQFCVGGAGDWGTRARTHAHAHAHTRTRTRQGMSLQLRIHVRARAHKTRARL